MLQMILSTDYEIFGNGSGDVQTCLIRPTSVLLELTTAYQIPLTLFVDVCEYWAFKAEQESGRLPAGYEPARWIEDQLVQAVQGGHDVQLHFHPQWLDYGYDPVHGWSVNLDYWRLPDVAGRLDRDGQRITLLGLFRRGKETLETLIEPHCPGYECLIFRAGAWCIQPEAGVLQAMRQAGLKVDSTVAPGLCFQGRLTVCDFRDTPCKPMWSVNTLVTKEDLIGRLWEIPVHTRRFAFWEYDWPTRLKRLVSRWSPWPPGCCGSFANQRKGLWATGVFRRLLARLGSQWVMFDYCVLTAREMERIVRDALQETVGEVADVPLIAIGHPKGFNNSHELVRFLERCVKWRREGQVGFTTFAWVAERILE